MCGFGIGGQLPKAFGGTTISQIRWVLDQHLFTPKSCPVNAKGVRIRAVDFFVLYHVLVF
jgi:hypothetical protein